MAKVKTKKRLEKRKAKVESIDEILDRVKRFPPKPMSIGQQHQSDWRTS